MVGGDLTDAKDYHPASLTNRIVRHLVDLVGRSGVNISILMGNHDYLRAGHAYFEFLSELNGIRFVSTIEEDREGDGPMALFLPHTKNPRADWAGLDLSHYSYVFMHQTAPGSVASNGQKMDGEALPSLKGPKVYSGDIHVPQVLGDIEYIGSPYHVHFGDRFTPRAVLLDRKGRAEDMHFPCLRRHTLTASSMKDLAKQIATTQSGDQVKVRLLLTPAEKHEWMTMRRNAIKMAEYAGLEVHGIELLVEPGQRRIIGGSAEPMLRPTYSDADAVLRYVLKEELGADALDMGLEFVK